MAANKNLKNLKLTLRDGATVLHLGSMEIWDGADLSLIRESLSNLYHERHCRSIGVDMSSVKYVPSGFFGMLYDWYERGVTIRLFDPLSQVRRMLWFSKFFHAYAEGAFELCPDPTLLVRATPLPAPATYQSVGSVEPVSTHF